MTSKEKLEDYGYEDIVVFDDSAYDDALIGVSNCCRAIYDFNKMVEGLMKRDGMTEEESIEWIEYNTIRACDYYGPDAPIVMYPVD